MPTDTASPTRDAKQIRKPGTPDATRRVGDAKKDDKPEAAKPKSKRKKLIIIAAAVLVLLAGGGYFVLGSSSGAVKEPVPGAVIAMDNMTLNLADNHFLRLKVGLQTVEGTDETMDTSKASQLIIAQFSNLPTSALSSDAARTAAKATLLTKIQEAYPDKILDVYYTDFVMQ